MDMSHGSIDNIPAIRLDAHRDRQRPVPSLARCAASRKRGGHLIASQDLAQRVPNARLVAVADQKADLAEGFAREFGIPKWYRSHQELLADSDVEAVAVVTSTSTHKEVVMDAAKSGKAMAVPSFSASRRVSESCDIIESSRIQEA